MLGCLAGVADRAVCDPLFQIGAAVADRAGRDFYKVWAAAAMPPVLQGAHRVAQDRRGFTFVNELRVLSVGLGFRLHFWFLTRGWRCVCETKDDWRTARKIVATNIKFSAPEYRGLT